MAYQKHYYLDASQGGDSVKDAVLKTDYNVDDIFWALNDIASKIPGALQPQDMLDAIKTVDGAGSGLDADYLRGQAPDSFAPVVHTHDLVTGAVAGFMSPADKTKLDGISEGGQMTGQEILTALAPVDGEGSGLNADQLDGYHANAFAFSGHTHNVASQASNGFMSATDKQKLDDIPPGGGQMTGAEILAALAPVDGSGSGLDADYLDGFHASTSYEENTIAVRADSGDLDIGKRMRLYDPSYSYYAYIMNYGGDCAIGYYDDTKEFISANTFRNYWDAAKDLGTSTHRWRNVYSTGLMQKSIDIGTGITLAKARKFVRRLHPIIGQVGTPHVVGDVKLTDPATIVQPDPQWAGGFTTVSIADAVYYSGLSAGSDKVDEVNLHTLIAIIVAAIKDIYNRI